MPAAVLEDVKTGRHSERRDRERRMHAGPASGFDDHQKKRSPEFVQCQRTRSLLGPLGTKVQPRGRRVLRYATDMFDDRVPQIPTTDGVGPVVPLSNQGSQAGNGHLCDGGNLGNRGNLPAECVYGDAVADAAGSIGENLRLAARECPNDWAQAVPGDGHGSDSAVVRLQQLLLERPSRSPRGLAEP